MWNDSSGQPGPGHRIRNDGFKVGPVPLDDGIPALELDRPPRDYEIVTLKIGPSPGGMMR